MVPENLLVRQPSLTQARLVMKTFIITTVAICALLPTSLIAQAAEVAEPAAEKKAAVPKDHTGISKAITKLMVDMMTGMGTLTDVASANAQAKLIKALPGKLKPLVEKAESLPAPTEAEKKTIKQHADAAEEKAKEVMMAKMKENLKNGPDPAAQAEIGQIIQGAIGGVNEEMEALVERIEKLYDIDDEGEEGSGGE